MKILLRSIGVSGRYMYRWLVPSPAPSAAHSEEKRLGHDPHELAALGYVHQYRERRRLRRARQLETGPVERRSREARRERPGDEREHRNTAFLVFATVGNLAATFCVTTSLRYTALNAAARSSARMICWLVFSMKVCAACTC
eukprot:1147973-Prymnesium_polylepis.2